MWEKLRLRGALNNTACWQGRGETRALLNNPTGTNWTGQGLLAPRTCRGPAAHVVLLLRPALAPVFHLGGTITSGWSVL